MSVEYLPAFATSPEADAFPLAVLSTMPAAITVMGKVMPIQSDGTIDTTHHHRVCLIYSSPPLPDYRSAIGVAEAFLR